MGNQPIASADKISAEDFNAYLAKYEDCIEAISASKGCKSTMIGTECRGQGTERFH
jgi:hypothetical protein